MSSRTDPSGFTLIEVLVVMLIISLLAGVVAPMVFRNVGDAKQQTARTQIAMLGMALDAYRLDNGTYPTTAQGLDALWDAPTQDPKPARWRGPYTQRAVPDDPWGRPYSYKMPGDSSRMGYDLFTLGRDGRPGGADEDADVTSWSPSK